MKFWQNVINFLSQLKKRILTVYAIKFHQISAQIERKNSIVTDFVTKKIIRLVSQITVSCKTTVVTVKKRFIIF